MPSTLSSYITPPGCRPASDRSSSTGQRGWNTTTCGDSRKNSPALGAPPTLRTLIVFRLTVLKSTASLKVILIGRLSCQTAFFGMLTLVMRKPAPPPPPLLHAASSSAAAADARARLRTRANGEEGVERDAVGWMDATVDERWDAVKWVTVGAVLIA